MKGTEMAEVKQVERPLSPHLQIYRWQVPMLTSILTRITGHALVAGVLLAVWWDAGERMREYLTGYTLADMAAMAQGDAPWPPVSASR